MRSLFAIGLALAAAGCAASMDAPQAGAGDADGDGFSDAVEAKFGTDATNATSAPDVARMQDVSFSDTVQTVGTGVPSVQCPADTVNSQTLTWSVSAQTGGAREAWVGDLVFSVAGAMTVNDVDLFVTGPDGSALGSGTGATNMETITVGGKRPLGDYQIEVRGCSGAGDVDVTASGTVTWIPSDAELLASP